MHWPVCRSNPSCARDYMPLPARCHDQHWRGKFSLLSLGLARPNHFPPTFLASLPRRSDSVLGEQSTAGAEGRGEPSVVSQSPLLLLPLLLLPLLLRRRWPRRRRLPPCPVMAPAAWEIPAKVVVIERVEARTIACGGAATPPSIVRCTLALVVGEHQPGFSHLAEACSGQWVIRILVWVRSERSLAVGPLQFVR